MTSEPSPEPLESFGEAKCLACGATIQKGVQSCPLCQEPLNPAVAGRKTTLRWNSANIDIRVSEAQDEIATHLFFGTLTLGSLWPLAIVCVTTGHYFVLLIVLAFLLGPAHLRTAVVLSRRRAVGMPTSARERLSAFVGSVGAIGLIISASGIAFYAVGSLLGFGLLVLQLESDAVNNAAIIVVFVSASIAALAVGVPMVIRLMKSGN